MNSMDDRHKAVKLTITFDDGHSEDFDIFIAAMGSGLTPVGKDKEGNPVYMAEEGKFRSTAIAKLSGSPDIAAGLLKTLSEIVEDLLTADPKVTSPILGALLNMQPKDSEKYRSTRTFEVRPKEN